MRASRSRGTPSAEQQKKKKTATRQAPKRRTASATILSGAGPQSRTPKRGRPRSPGLTDEVWNIIVAYVRAGTYDHVAAEAAGISVRTFHDWIARGEGRSPRRSSALHREFAAAVGKARAEARLAAETRVHQSNPTFWLSHAARSKPGREGWTEPVADDAAPSWAMPGSLERASIDELKATIAALDTAIAHEDARMRAAEGATTDEEDPS